MLAPDWIPSLCSSFGTSRASRFNSGRSFLTSPVFTCHLSKSAEDVNRNVINPDLAHSNERMGKRARSMADLRGSSVLLRDVIRETDEENTSPRSTSSCDVRRSHSTNSFHVQSFAARDVPVIFIEDRSMSDQAIVLASSSKNGDADSMPEEDRGNKKASSAHASDVAVEVEKGGAKEHVPEHAQKQYTEDEEKILEILRDVVRKCTNSDPMKRPTAVEVLEYLDKCPVK